MEKEGEKINMKDIERIGRLRIKYGNNVGIFEMRKKEDIMDIMIIGESKEKLIGDLKKMRIRKMEKREEKIIDMIMSSGKKEIDMVKVGIKREVKRKMGEIGKDEDIM